MALTNGTRVLSGISLGVVDCHPMTLTGTRSSDNLARHHINGDRPERKPAWNGFVVRRHSARMAQRPDGADREIHDWFWSDTAVGALLMALAQRMREDEDKDVQAVAFGIAR